MLATCQRSTSYAVRGCDVAVHTTFESFAKALDKHVVAVERSLDTWIQDAVKAGAQSVWIVTPTDTGFLRSNWVLVEAGAEPPVGRFGSYAELFGAGVFDSGGRMARAEQVGIQMIDDINTKAESLRVGDTVEIANGTLYAIYIEGGHSAQAPQGMLRPALQALEARAAQFRPTGVFQ